MVVLWLCYQPVLNSFVRYRCGDMEVGGFWEGEVGVGTAAATDRVAGGRCCMMVVIAVVVVDGGVWRGVLCGGWLEGGREGWRRGELGRLWGLFPSS